MEYCRFCFRPIREGKVCEYCRETLCEVCKERLSRGYCAVCGRLVCDVDSSMIGFARVCNDCIDRYGVPTDYEEFKRFLIERHRPQGGKYFQSRYTLTLGDSRLITKAKYIFVGFDDFDSPYGMCTTYLAAILTMKLSEVDGVEFLDYPLLVRLNPNIPMKTRGNAAVCLRLRIRPGDFSDVRDIILGVMDGMSHAFFPKTQPAAVFYLNDTYVLDRRLNIAYMKALRRVLPRSMLMGMLGQIQHGYIEVYYWGSGEKIGRGIVGASAAVGAVFEDYTYELLAYRKKENVGVPRFIDRESVIMMDSRFFPYVYDSVDGGRILIAPSGPDPVLFGIRGDFPDKLLEAFSMINHEDLEMWCIFRTNQGTNAHLRRPREPSDARPYETVLLDVEVDNVERMGDRVILNGRASGYRILAYAYRLQRSLQSALMKLDRGDVIRLALAVFERGEKVIVGNVEEFIPIYLHLIEVRRNPPCPVCSARLKKKSREEMYCRKCGFRMRDVFKIVVRVARRGLSRGKRYLSPPRAHRHLTLPNERIVFRMNKISGLYTPVLINPMYGTSKEKILKFHVVREIVEPGVV